MSKTLHICSLIMVEMEYSGHSGAIGLALQWQSTAQSMQAQYLATLPLSPSDKSFTHVPHIPYTRNWYWPKAVMLSR